jgi:hypothetical protein
MRKLTGGLGLFLVLSLFLMQTANGYGIYGPQTHIEDKYLYFGSDIELSTSRNGIDIAVDYSSISFQTVKAVITVDWNLIVDREISGFTIMGNKVVVDFVQTYLDTQTNTYKEYYYVDININPDKIGSLVYFQVAGLHENNQGEQFVVAWSAETQPYQFKPLPVIDQDAVNLLSAILQKLEDIRIILEEKLEKILKAIESMYTPSPESVAALDSAMDAILEKLPMSQMTEQISEMNDTLQESVDQLHSTASSDLKLGGKFRLIPELAESEISFLDLSDYRDQVILFRTIMNATIWIYFFYMLMSMLTPKPSI